jgi:hypothetical protein
MLLEATLKSHDSVKSHLVPFVFEGGLEFSLVYTLIM